MRILKRSLMVLCVIGFIIQFYPIKQTNPPVSFDFNDPIEIKNIVRNACYDCHSNETRWPWYSYIAPASWVIVHDVKKAREKFNFSSWGLIDIEEQNELRQEMWEEVEEGKMPLRRYLILHPEARLSKEQRSMLREWALSIPSYTSNSGLTKTQK